MMDEESIQEPMCLDNAHSRSESRPIVVSILYYIHAFSQRVQVDLAWCHGSSSINKNESRSFRMVGLLQDFCVVSAGRTGGTSQASAECRPRVETLHASKGLGAALIFVYAALSGVT